LLGTRKNKEIKLIKTRVSLNIVIVLIYSRLIVLIVLIVFKFE